MKQKTITIAVTCSLAVVVAITAGLYRYSYIQSAQQPDSDRTPVISYESQPNDSSRPTMNDDDKAAADSPGQKQPTITPQKTVADPSTRQTSNAPKQEEVRRSVSKEYVYYPLLSANDPGYSNNWALTKVKAPAAWNIATGNNQTIVAVIDTGFGLNHEDLTDRWHRNTAEAGMTALGDRCWTGISRDKSSNNCDDDNNGYVDDWRGWNFSIGDNNPMAGRTNPAGSGVAHGTETAGLVGASGNNATGITTINWQTKIMPLQALSDTGPGYTSDIAAAIYYAVDNGADVINLSLGGTDYDPALEVATDYAYDNNVVVIAAAGNCGSGNEPGCETHPAGTMMFPALNDHVIAVGASDFYDSRASFSSYGPGLDVMAPGSGSIISPTWTDTNATSFYSGELYGTSYAAPQVASLASLIKSVRPTATADDIAALLLATTTKLPAMGTNLYTTAMGHGLINAERALTVSSSLNSISAAPKLLQAGGPKSEHSFAKTDTLGSGCVADATSYCTVRLRNNQSGQERYLPYQQINSDGLTGWTWRATMLESGEWNTRAVQGTTYSSVYSLINK